MTTAYWAQADRLTTLIKLEKFELAKKAADNLASEYPEEPEVIMLQGIVTYELGEMRVAKALSSELQRMHPATFEADTLSYLLATAEGDARAMIGFAQRRVSIDPEDADWHVKLGHGYLESENVQKAETSMITALSLSPLNPDVLTAFASCKIYKAEFETAKHFIIKSLALDPEHRRAKYLNSIVSLELGETSNQVEHELLEVLRGNPTDEMAEHSRLSLLHYYQQRSTIVSFFTAKGFARYRIEWTLGRVVVMIICFKGVLLFGVFGILYLLVNWYGAILFNSFAMFHKRWKYLQNRDLRIEGYLGVASLILTALIISLRDVIGFNIWEAIYYSQGVLLSVLVIASYLRVKKPPEGVNIRSYGIPILAIVLFGLYSINLTHCYHWGACAIAGVLLLIFGFFYTLNIVGRRGVRFNPS